MTSSKTVSFFALILASFGPLVSGDGLGDSVYIDHDEEGTELTWMGAPKRFYIIQESSNLEDDHSWRYLEVLERGAGKLIRIPIDSEAQGMAEPRQFFRLQFTDQYLSKPYSIDLDGDSISNLLELAAETNPFSNIDLDANGLADDWEAYHGIVKPSEDPDFDTFDNRLESLIGSSPLLGYKEEGQMEVFSPN